MTEVAIATGIMVATMIALSTGEACAADPLCPSSAEKGLGIWCSAGLAGSHISIARNGNSGTDPVPASYRICLDKRLGPGTRVDVTSTPMGVLTDQNRCGCFQGAQIQVQNNSSAPSPIPQQRELGGTYQAFRGPSCEKDAPVFKVGKPRTVIANCGMPDATGKDCTKVLKGLGAGRAGRLCFPGNFVANSNNTGNISLRLNGYVPPPKPEQPPPQDGPISSTCLDVFQARSVTIRLGLWDLVTPDPNTHVRFTVAPLRR